MKAPANHPDANADPDRSANGGQREVAVNPVGSKPLDQITEPRDDHPENRSVSQCSHVESTQKPANLISALARWHVTSRLGLHWPVFLAIALMLPRLSHPHFGLLDDGVTMAGARAVITMGPDVAFTKLAGSTGRFFPMMWWFWGIVYWLGGPSPLIFFFANCLLLTSITAGLIWIAHSLTGNRFLARVTGLLFLIGGPIVEASYTISKSETLQVGWLTLALALFVASRRIIPLKRQVFGGIALAVVLLGAMLSKETSVVLVAISFVGLVAAWGWQKLARQPAGLRARLIFFAASLLAAMVFLGLRSHYASVDISAGSYTQFYSITWDTLASSALRWLSWLIRDYPYLFPILVFVIVSRILGTLAQGWILFDAGIWMLGWLAIFLPWQGISEYYLLPFSLGCALFCGLGLRQMVRSLRCPAPRSLRRLAKSCLIFSGICLVTVAVNEVNSFRLQLAIDDANADVMDFIADQPGPSRVYVNIPSTTEVFIEMGLQLAGIRGRSDITLESFKVPWAPPDGKQDFYYILTPIFYNQLFPSIRIGFDENSAHHWNNLLEQALGGRPDTVYASERRIQMLDFGPQSLVCYLTNGKGGLFCNYPRPFVDARVFRYGWRVYRISRTALSADVQK